ncbi:hypothetical protein [Shimia sp.]|uniref:hypothetical protein n=1 Tax=Shimia sp. TaxID=1954381 RepID=UPI003B8B6C71
MTIHPPFLENAYPNPSDRMDANSANVIAFCSCASAWRIVANPCATDTPLMRLLAWSVLKSERGQPVIQSRLQRS